jgi:hypothetical protein
MKFTASDGMQSAVIYTNACMESKVKTGGYATVHLRQCTISTYMPGTNLIRVTETTSMGESNGTNLKPILPIAFFKQVYENLEVTVLCRDGWRDRLRSIYTMLGAKALK